jgi:hypothetical protein
MHLRDDDEEEEEEEDDDDDDDEDELWLLPHSTPRASHVPCSRAWNLLDSADAISFLTLQLDSLLKKGKEEQL